jgi:hypothetical protein
VRRSEAVVKVSCKGLVLSLALVRTEDSFLHEEIDPLFLEGLKQSFLRDEVVKHPPVVDEKTAIVLDGTHRVAAAEEIKLKWLPACLVDYKNPAIEVKEWYRTLRNLPSKELLTALLKGEAIKHFGTSKDKVKELVASREAAFGILTGKWGLCVKYEKPTWEIYLLIEKIEGFLRNLGVTIDYRDPEEAIFELEKRFIDGIMVVSKIPKEEIIREVSAGRRFPSKATRHVVPGRMLNLPVPIEILRIDELENAMAKFTSFIRGKKPRLLPPNSRIEGRRYEEEVHMFE